VSYSSVLRYFPIPTAIDVDNIKIAAVALAYPNNFGGRGCGKYAVYAVF